MGEYAKLEKVFSIIGIGIWGRWSLRWAFRVALVIRSPPADVEVQETRVGSLGLEDPLRGAWHPLQYFCLENLMDRGAWWTTVPRVAKSLTKLKRLSMHTCSLLNVALRGLSLVKNIFAVNKELSSGFILMISL